MFMYRYVGLSLRKQINEIMNKNSSRFRSQNSLSTKRNQLFRNFQQYTIERTLFVKYALKDSSFSGYIICKSLIHRISSLQKIIH